MRILLGLSIILIGIIPVVALQTFLDSRIHSEFGRTLIDGALLGLLVGSALIVTSRGARSKRHR